jgi:hypothetical protein
MTFQKFRVILRKLHIGKFFLLIFYFWQDYFSDVLLFQQGVTHLFDIPYEVLTCNIMF